MKNNYETVPQEMKGLKRWLVYKKEWSEKRQKFDKIPYNAKTGGKAQSNNASTWCDYQTAINALSKGYSGLGFMLGDGIFGVDIDGVELTDPLVKEVITTLPSYAEASPSGKGVHVICKGQLPAGARRRGNIEMYDKGRFFTVTGDKIGEYSHLSDCTDSIKSLHDKYLGQKEKPSTKPIKPIQSDLSDREIIQKIEASKQADKFFQLYNLGAGTGDHSVDDMALCSMLAFWTRCNFSQMDSIFRSSALMRDKWDRKQVGTTYGAITIQKAVNMCSEVYDPQSYGAKRDFNGSVEQESQTPYLLNARGAKLKVYENLKVLLNQYNIKVRFNELTRKVEIEGGINVQDSYDASITRLNTLCQVNEFNINKDKQYDFMYCVAMDNRFNSVLEYLNECKDKYLKEPPHEPIINELFKTIAYVHTEDIEFNNKILLKVLMCCIHIAHNTGQSFIDFVLILHGKQGIGKTQWIKSLMPKEHLNEFFKEGVILKLKDKDSLIENTGYWIIELGEFGKTLKENDRDELKTFIGKSIDEYRSPYARTAMKHPRRTAMIASVNDDEFFRDVTGNRRFVVFETSRLNFQHGIDVDLLWGELMLMYEDDKISTFLNDEESKIIAEKNKRYMVKSTEQLILEEYIPFNQPVEQWKPVTSMALAQYIESETGRKLDPRRIGKSLNTMGYEPKNVRLSGIRGRYYILPYIKNVSIPF